MKNAIAVCAVLALLCLGSSAQAEPTYQAVNFSSSFNAYMTDMFLFPRYGPAPGNQLFGGVPFTTSDRVWLATEAVGAPRVLEINNLSLSSVSRVYTLINSVWGTPGPSSYAYVEMFGTGGAYYKKDLVGNVDIRNATHGPNYTNEINCTTTQVYDIWDDHDCVRRRLDMQRIDLPTLFDGQTLTTIRLVDYGRDGYAYNPLAQRIFVTGITAEYGSPYAVPEPSSIVMFLTGATALCGVGFRKRK